MEIENDGCRHVLHLIDTFKDTPIIQEIHDFLTVEIFPITLGEYSLLCNLQMSKRIKSLSMMVVHLMGEELKKRLPHHVSRIEQERVKYLTLIHGQRVDFNIDLNLVYDLSPEDRKSVWMQITADLFRIRRQIRQLENLLGPLLQKKNF